MSTFRIRGLVTFMLLSVVGCAFTQRNAVAPSLAGTDKPDNPNILTCVIVDERTAAP